MSILHAAFWGLLLWCLHRRSIALKAAVIYAVIWGLLILAAFLLDVPPHLVAGPLVLLEFGLALKAIAGNVELH